MPFVFEWDFMGHLLGQAFSPVIFGQVFASFLAAQHSFLHSAGWLFASQPGLLSLVGQVFTSFFAASQGLSLSAG